MLDVHRRHIDGLTWLRECELCDWEHKSQHSGALHAPECEYCETDTPAEQLASMPDGEPTAESISELLSLWRASLPTHPDAFDAADEAVSACITDLEHVATTGSLPPWYPRWPESDTESGGSES